MNDYFGDLKGPLVIAADTKRDFGQDTANAAIGRLPGGDTNNGKSKHKLRLNREDARAVVLCCEEMHHESTQRQKTRLVTHRTREHKIDFLVDCMRLSKSSKKRDMRAAEFMERGETLHYRLVVTAENSRQTELNITVTLDRNGFLWLSVRGNPTSLLNAYNAHAVAISGVGRHAERRIMMRVLFAVVRRIVRSSNKNFEWQPETRQRIKDLAFRLCPAQIFTYVVHETKTPQQLLGFLRAVYSVPYCNRDIHRLLHDDLGFEMQARGTPEGVQTLLFIFRKGGRISWSVAYYDKMAKASRDAEIIKLEVGDDTVTKFLSRAVRVDITIHDEGQREMQYEADISSRENAVITADNYCRAITIMDKGEGKTGKRFVNWLLDHVFGELLKLWTLLSYVPSKVDEAQRALEAYNINAAKAFAEWCRKGFEHLYEDRKVRRRASFEQFLINHAAHRVTRAIARGAHAKLLEIKLDPDIPLRAYDAFYETTFAWDLSDDDRHKLAEAREACDDETVLRIQKRGRRNAVEVNNEIRRSFVKMIKAAHTPANTLGAGAGG